MTAALGDDEKRDAVSRVSGLVSGGMSLTQACEQVAQTFVDAGKRVSGRTLQRYVQVGAPSLTRDTLAEKATSARIGIGIDALQDRVHRLMRLHEKAVARLEQQQLDSEAKDSDVAPPSDVAIKRSVDTAAALARAETELFERGARLNPTPPADAAASDKPRPAKDIVDLAAEKLRRAQEGA